MRPSGLRQESEWMGETEAIDPWLWFQWEEADMSHSK